ncbi:MAG: hypothetical protein QOK88_00080 [Nitrososphaeraceae archaeon]|jgi:hypothetical protein|nr:hypothetical protein [Nitrososphaeraceae archaeon]MDW0133883.1 hypothetical protein [Nitrososphaeraceae archaeon]MDW0155791.1 hypothetical protein [Nitrososphaeraceae archaeon]
MNQNKEISPSFFQTYNLEDSPFGASYSEWLAKWWQCYLISDRKRNEGPVFMIPGKIIGVQEGINERKFKIDRDKAILLSPINWIGINNANDNKHEQKLRQDAKLEIDIINRDAISVLVDDKLEMRDNCIRASTPNFFSLDGKMAITDGYWLFLKPNSFTTGKHTISSFGSCRSGTIQVNMKYHLTVK